MDIEKEFSHAWYDIDKVLLTPSPFAQPEFYPGPELKEGSF